MTYEEVKDVLSIFDLTIKDYHENDYSNTKNRFQVFDASNSARFVVFDDGRYYFSGRNADALRQMFMSSVNFKNRKMREIKRRDDFHGYLGYKQRSYG
jgi:hypothetical protein